MRLLLTRPAEDGQALAAKLRAMGHEPILSPVMEIVPRPDVTLPLEGVQALLVTSRNGARALAAATPRRDIVVYAVGEQSAREANAAHFPVAHSAGGDVAALASLVEQACNPGGGALVHAVGSVEAGDLSAALAAKGFTVRRAVLYESRPATHLPQAVRTALQKGLADGVLFYSPRTARLFGELAGAAGLGPALAPLTAYCLSPAVAEAAAPLGFAACRLAPVPSEAALLALIQA